MNFGLSCSWWGRTIQVISRVFPSFQPNVFCCCDAHKLCKILSIFQSSHGLFWWDLIDDGAIRSKNSGGHGQGTDISVQLQIVQWMRVGGDEQMQPACGVFWGPKKTCSRFGDFVEPWFDDGRFVFFERTSLTRCFAFTMVSRQWRWLRLHVCFQNLGHHEGVCHGERERWPAYRAMRITATKRKSVIFLYFSRL